MRLVKISRINIPAGSRLPRRPKRKWSDLIPRKSGGTAYNKEEEEEEEEESEINSSYCCLFF